MEKEKTETKMLSAEASAKRPRSDQSRKKRSNRNTYVKYIRDLSDRSSLGSILSYSQSRTRSTRSRSSRSRSTRSRSARSRSTRSSSYSSRSRSKNRESRSYSTDFRRSRYSPDCRRTSYSPDCRRSRYSPDCRRSHYSPDFHCSRYSQSPRGIDAEKAKLNPSRCVGVFGLSRITNRKHLQTIFSKFGKIRDIRLIMDGKTGRSREFAFLYFKHISDATYAVKACSDLHLHGRRVRVDFSLTKRPHNSTPGVYMGSSRRKRNRNRRYSRRKSRSSSYSSERERRDQQRRDVVKKYDCDVEDTHRDVKRRKV